MKKTLVVIVAALVVCTSTVAFAEGTTATLSLKGWYNDWKRTFTTGDSIKSDSPVLMLGPALNVKFGNDIFLGITYLATTEDYEFNYPTTPPSPHEVTKISRKDMDLVAGYMFTPRFGAFIGYKSIKADVSITYPGTSFPSDSGTIDMTGPGIGILGNIPLSQSIALYGNLSYMFLTYTEEFVGFPTYEEDNPGASIEIGIAAAFTKNFSGSIGFKAQSFEGKDSDITDDFSGLTFSLNYTF